MAKLTFSAKMYFLAFCLCRSLFSQEKWAMSLPFALPLSLQSSGTHPHTSHSLSLPHGQYRFDISVTEHPSIRDNRFPPKDCHWLAVSTVSQVRLHFWYSVEAMSWVDPVPRRLHPNLSDNVQQKAQGIIVLKNETHYFIAV